jgi:hypothetical protein
MFNVVMLSVDWLYVYKISVNGWLLWRHNKNFKKRYKKVFEDGSIIEI